MKLNIKDNRKIDKEEFKKRWLTNLTSLGLEKFYDENDPRFVKALGIWMEACEYKSNNDTWANIKKIAAEYSDLVKQSLDLIYSYRDGQIPESDCWPTIHKRDKLKKELVAASLAIYEK